MNRLAVQEGMEGLGALEHCPSQMKNHKKSQSVVKMSPGFIG